MIPNHSQFLDAIVEMNLIRIEFYSKPDAGVVDRECAPLDYGPAAAAESAENCYWIWDFSSLAGSNLRGLVAEQIVSVRVLGLKFDPAKLGLDSRQWSVPRAWAGVQVPAVPVVRIDSTK